MSAENGTEPVGLGSIVLELQEILKDLEEQSAQLFVAYKAKEEEARRIRTMIRTGTGETKKPGPKKKGPGPKSKLFNEERLEEGYKALKASADKFGVIEDIPGSFTVNMAGEALGYKGPNPSGARTLVEQLREQGLVRMVGQRVVTGTRASHIYVLSDGD